jgi:glycerol uptake facilitator protein
VAGALLCKVLVDDEGAAVGYGAVEVSDRFLQGDVLPGFLAELLGTFFLMWAIMGVAVNPQGARDWAGLVIGGALGVAVMTLAPLTGAGLNPARAFGPNLIADDFAVFDGAFLVTYVLGPVVGALLAGVLYTALVINPGRRGRVGDAEGGRRPVDTLSGREESRRDEGAAGASRATSRGRSTGSTEPRPGRVTRPS